MSNHLFPSTFQTSMEMRFTPRPAPLHQIKRSQNRKKMILTSYLPPLVVLLEGQGSVEFVVSMMMLIVQNACSNVLGVRELDIRKGLVVQDSTHQHNCLQLHLAL